MIKVLVADDHAIVREGLKQILAENSTIVVAGEASTAQEVIRKVQTGSWDVVVLDISLPDRSGLEVLKQIKNQFPTLPILVLTMHAEEQYAVRVLKAGASGYLTKESAPEQLVEALQKVARGGRYVSASLAERLVFDLRSDPNKLPHESLSDREFQILCMIASGKTLTEIAQELYVSIKTVSTHRTRILQKMGMRNNAELIHYAITHSLIT
ncbi:MAG: response regulator transcription factor [Acidobacteriota bacterium]